MASILYVKASPRLKRSYSISVADAFLETYAQSHPDDKVNTIGVFERSLPVFDLGAVAAKYKIMHGQEHSKGDEKIWSEIVKTIEEFKSADKYVFAVPMWNFSIPYHLKQYIDILVQPDQTFGVTEDGSYEGLVKDKPVFVAYSRGGEYLAGTDAEALDLQKRYLELILGFMGLTDIRSVVIEPTLAAGRDVAQQKLAEAVAKARQLATEF